MNKLINLSSLNLMFKPNDLNFKLDLILIDFNLKFYLKYLIISIWSLAYSNGHEVKTRS